MWQRRKLGNGWRVVRPSIQTDGLSASSHPGPCAVCDPGCFCFRELRSKTKRFALILSLLWRPLCDGSVLWKRVSSNQARFNGLRTSLYDWQVTTFGKTHALYFREIAGYGAGENRCEWFTSPLKGWRGCVCSVAFCFVFTRETVRFLLETICSTREGLCVGLEILTELSTTFVLICSCMMAGPPGDPRGTGLAKKFVCIFSKRLQKTWRNFSATQYTMSLRLWTWIRVV